MSELACVQADLFTLDLPIFETQFGIFRFHFYSMACPLKARLCVKDVLDALDCNHSDDGSDDDRDVEDQIGSDPDGGMNGDLADDDDFCSSDDELRQDSTDMCCQTRRLGFES